MDSKNYYDVTHWNVGNPQEDIGEVINSMIADIKSRQMDADLNEEGKPGAVIFIPSGDYHLRTQVKIDISYLKIMGTGHGFTSSSIRFNTSENELANWYEIWPGGSRVLVDLEPKPDEEESSGAAFYVERSGAPRISSVEFSNFCIDGLHFVDDELGNDEPENTYVNGKTGIYIASAQDSFRITEMGMVYLEHGVTSYHADAMTIHDNFIAECGNCIELRASGQASKITDNLIGAGYKGYSIFAQNFGGLLVATNNVFPRGSSSVHFDGVVRSSVTSNRFHSFYPGMLVFERHCSENLVSSNHFLRDHEPWTPMLNYDNGLDDTFGLLSICGKNNSIIANHISETIAKKYLKPTDVIPVIIHVTAGSHNYISNNHIVATTEPDVVEGVSMEPDATGDASTEKDACFSAQVDALLTADRLVPLDVIAVLVEREATHNTVLDSGSQAEVILDKRVNAFRATPTIGV